MGCAVSDTTLAAAGRETGGEGESAPARPSLGRIRVRDANLRADGRAEAACRRQMPGPIRRLPAASQRTDGYPLAVRTDSGPEFTSRAFMVWAQSHGIRHILIEPGRPMQNGYIESFNGKFRDECLAMEWFRNRIEAKIVIEDWRIHYNEVRPHSSLQYATPAEFRRGCEISSTTGATNL